MRYEVSFRSPARWFAACVAAAVMAAQPAQARCQLQQLEIPVHIQDRRPIATLTLNGNEVHMLVDSGAFFSLVSPATAEQLKLPLSSLPYGIRIQGYAGEVEAKLTTVKQVGLRGNTLPDVQFIVGGNELGAGIQGILGRNFLAIADTEYDLAHGAVRLTFPNAGCAKADMAYWAGNAPVVVVPLLTEYGTSDVPVKVDVKVNGARAEALLDTGAPISALSLRTARRAGIKEEQMVPKGRVGGAGQGLVRSWWADVAQLEIGGQTLRSSRLEVNDTRHGGTDLLIGLDYFLSHRIYVSKRQEKVYITWNGTPVFDAPDGAQSRLDTQYAALPKDLEPADADAFARRGEARLAAGQPAAALEDLNRACELAPARARYRYSRALVHLALRQNTQAVADLDQALKLEPTLSEARLDRARLAFRSGDRTQALLDLHELDERLPSSAHARADMADLYAALSLPASALKQHGAWLSTHPTDLRRGRVLNNRCWLLNGQNQELKQALADCEEAVGLDGQDANARDSLAWVRLRLGDHRRALKDFDEAIRLKPAAASYFGRSVAHFKLGDGAASARDLAEARRLDAEIDAKVQRVGFGSVDGVAALGRPQP